MKPLLYFVTHFMSSNQTDKWTLAKLGEFLIREVSNGSNELESSVDLRTYFDQPLNLYMGSGRTKVQVTGLIRDTSANPEVHRKPLCYMVLEYYNSSRVLSVHLSGTVDQYAKDYILEYRTSDYLKVKGRKIVFTDVMTPENVERAKQEAKAEVVRAHGVRDMVHLGIGIVAGHWKGKEVQQRYQKFLESIVQDFTEETTLTEKTERGIGYLMGLILKEQDENLTINTSNIAQYCDEFLKSYDPES